MKITLTQNVEGLMGEPETVKIELTPRQSEIAALVDTGMTNKEIADQLFISERTVKYHVACLLQKTGVRSRNRLMKAMTASNPFTTMPDLHDGFTGISRKLHRYKKQEAELTKQLAFVKGMIGVMEAHLNTERID